MKSFLLEFSKLIFRKARLSDLNEIIKMLSDDILGKDREDINDLQIYQNAFEEISKNKNDYLLVIEYEKQIIATCHLTIMHSLTLKASKRINIEAVRVKNSFRGNKIGEFMFQEIIKFAKENNVKIMQLTTNKDRLNALKFYQKLGFKNSHYGMKLKIEDLQDPSLLKQLLY